MLKFDCQQMPEEVKHLFFDTYRQRNNTTVSVYVAEERELLKNWLIESGANIEDDVIISYYWVEEEIVDKFDFEEENDDDDDEQPKVKKIKEEEDIEVEPTIRSIRKSTIKEESID